MTTTDKILEAAVPTTLVVALYVAGFGLFLDIALNGPLASVGRTLTALLAAGVSLIFATVVATIVVREVITD